MITWFRNRRYRKIVRSRLERVLAQESTYLQQLRLEREQQFWDTIWAGRP